MAFHLFTASCFKQERLRSSLIHFGRGCIVTQDGDFYHWRSCFCRVSPPALWSDGAEKKKTPNVSQISDRFISSFAVEVVEESFNLQQSLVPNDLWPALRILVLDC